MNRVLDYSDGLFALNSENVRVKNEKISLDQKGSKNKIPKKSSFVN